jgi:hypothetical protein
VTVAGSTFDIGTAASGTKRIERAVESVQNVMPAEAGIHDTLA